MTTTVNIHEAKTHLSKLLERVRAGDTIVIAKAGQPIAQLTAYRPPAVAFGDLDDLGWTISDIDWDDAERAAAELWSGALDDDVR